MENKPTAQDQLTALSTLEHLCVADGFYTKINPTFVDNLLHASEIAKLDGCKYLALALKPQ